MAVIWFVSLCKIMVKNKIRKSLLEQGQLLSDEFVLKNIGFFNHAVAGLSEIIGIIFLCLSIGLFIVFFNGANNQSPLFITIFLTQIIISFNFWRYVFTNSPGETILETITFNAILFSISSLFSFFLLIRSK